MTGSDGMSEGAAHEAPAGGMQNQMQSMIAGMSTAEKVIALGSVLFLVIDAILGEMILDDYGVSQLEFLLPLGSLIAIWRHNKGRSHWHELYPWIVEAMAGAFAAMGLWFFVDWLLDGFNGLSGSQVFYEIIYWAAIALLGYGAWLLHTSHD